MHSVYRDIHDGLREELVRSLGRNRFRLWFRDTSVVDVGEHGVTLAVPNDVHRTWLQYTFGDALRSACEKVLGDGVEVHFRVSSDQEQRRLLREKLPQRPEEWEELLERRVPKPSLSNYVVHPLVGDDVALAEGTRAEGTRAEGSPAEPVPAGSARTPSRCAPVAFPRMSGRFPVMMLRQLLEGGAIEGAASMVLHGATGSGKSHLLLGLERDHSRRMPGQTLFLTARRFTQRYVTALRAKDVDALRAFEIDLSSRQVVLLDDLDELDSREATQHELVRLLDRCTAGGTRFVFAARQHPRDIPGLSPRLRSRLLGGIVLSLAVPDRPALAEILRRRANDVAGGAFCKADREPIACIGEEILDRTSSVLGAVELMDRWAAASAETGAPLAREWLEELGPSVAATARDEVIRRAKDLVSDHFSIKRNLLDEPTKVRSARFPRRVAMYLVYRACALPLGELGSAFGLRSHSSVSRSIREMRDLRTQDAGVEQLVDGLLARL